MNIMILATALVATPLQSQGGVRRDNSHPVFDETDVIARSERVRQAQLQAEQQEMRAAQGQQEPDQKPKLPAEAPAPVVESSAQAQKSR